MTFLAQTGYCEKEIKTVEPAKATILARGLLRCRAKRDHHLPKTGEQKLAGGLPDVSESGGLMQTDLIELHQLPHKGRPTNDGKRTGRLTEHRS